jgi:hypothetical protein
LVDSLRSVGVLVEGHNFRSAQGGERQCDCARWNVSYAQPCIPLAAAAGPWSGLYIVHSWDTMTQCARRGIQIDIDGTEIAVHALSSAAGSLP